MLSIFCRLLSLALALCLGAPLVYAASVAPPVVRPYVLDALLSGLIDQQGVVA